MRVEDLDSQRSKPEMVQANLNELRWLGLKWDEGPQKGGPHAPYLQSQRFSLYREALGMLRGNLFECYLSRKDLREIASAPHGGAPLYGELQRSENERLKPQKQAEGKAPSLRFRVDRPVISFEDKLQGPQSFTTSDFIVKRADGEWAYQLAVVADDIAMNITEVVRGDDLLESTAAQLLLYDALGATPPAFLHVPLLLDETGERMSKRKGSLTLTALKDEGVAPERVVGLLAYSLGLLASPKPLSVKDAAALYRPDHLSPTPFKLSSQHLAWLRAAS